MKKLLIATTTLVTILFIATVVHIAVVIPDDYVVDNATIQIGSIKLEAPISDSKSSSIYNSLSDIEGVKNVKIFKEKGIVLYYFDNNQLDTEEIANSLKYKIDYDFEKFYASNDLQNKKSCPAIVDNSFSKKLIYAIQKIF